MLTTAHLSYVPYDTRRRGRRRGDTFMTFKSEDAAVKRPGGCSKAIYRREVQRRGSQQDIIILLPSDRILRKVMAFFFA